MCLYKANDLLKDLSLKLVPSVQPFAGYITELVKTVCLSLNLAAFLSFCFSVCMYLSRVSNALVFHVKGCSL